MKMQQSKITLTQDIYITHDKFWTKEDLKQLACDICSCKSRLSSNWNINILDYYKKINNIKITTRSI